MAFVECHYHSDVLKRACSMNLIIPQKVQTQIGMKSAGGGIRRYPVLYLLHGRSDDHTIWMRRTAIERHVADLELMVVMPDGQRSFYTDMEHGDDYFTFIADELPEVVASLFPASTAREENFIAGLSMGGYGAFKVALRRPERFAGAASLSGVMDINWVTRDLQGEAGIREAHHIFGDFTRIPGSDNDLFALLSQARHPLPRLWQCCGTEDGLYADNIRFRDAVRAQKRWDYHYVEYPGNHSWQFWDSHILEAIQFLVKK